VQLKKQLGDFKSERTDMVKDMITLTADRNEMMTTIASLKQTHEADVTALNVQLQHKRNAISKVSCTAVLSYRRFISQLAAFF
jgi:hypothetical protein